MSAPAVFQLKQRDTFEQNVTRALVAGGVAGAAHVAAFRVGNALSGLLDALRSQPFPAPEADQLVPLSLLATIAAAGACIRGGDRLDRALLWAMALVLPVLPWFFGLSPAWTLAFSGAMAGGVMVRAHLCERGEDRQVASGRAGWINYAL